MEIRNFFHSNQKFRKFGISANQRRTDTKSISNGASNEWLMQHNSGLRLFCCHQQCFVPQHTK